MDNGPMTDWYINLNQAPWSPPGWVFGAAWTTIMICFSIYMAYLFKFFKDSKLRKLPCFMVLGVDFFTKKGGPIQSLNGAAQ